MTDIHLVSIATHERRLGPGRDPSHGRRHHGDGSRVVCSGGEREHGGAPDISPFGS